MRFHEIVLERVGVGIIIILPCHVADDVVLVEYLELNGENNTKHDVVC